MWKILRKFTRIVLPFFLRLSSKKQAAVKEEKDGAVIMDGRICETS